MKSNDEHVLRTLLAAGADGVLETQFKFAAQKRLQEAGLIRYRPGSALPEGVVVASRPLVLTSAGQKAARAIAPESRPNC